MDANSKAFRRLSLKELASMAKGTFINSVDIVKKHSILANSEANTQATETENV